MAKKTNNTIGKEIGKREFILTESQFLQQVIALAKIYQWEVHHVFEQEQYAHRTCKGFPDISMYREVCDEVYQVVYAELKSEKGILTEEQYFWLYALQMAGQETYLWKPTDEDWEEIKRVLEV